MLFFMVFFMLTRITCTTSGNAGSILFYNRHPRTVCWNEDDIAKLRARKTFEQLIPAQVNPDRINAKYIKDTLRYFRRALRFVDKDVDDHTAPILRDALADTIGAHLRSELLPTVRFAYYAGYVPYRYARQLDDFFDDLKKQLNTQGLGWKLPERIPQWSNLTVGKILIGSGRLFDPCASLVTKRDSNTCIHLPTAKLDDEHAPSVIVLPFKTGGLASLTSPDSENILLKYYTTVSRCILQSSPENCRHSDFVNFNNEMWHWMKREVAPHLVDEKLYAAYGGVLRIAAAVQNYGKGLSRRNLFEYQNAEMTRWHPWKALSQSYLYINTDWTPQAYVGFVLLAALAIYLLQICYNYVFGDASDCNCKGRSRKSSCKDVAFSNIETSIPAMSHQSAVYYSDIKREKRSVCKTKTSSLGSIRTQKVYDLNENAEKHMAVIMSDNESNASLASKSDDESVDDDHVIDLGQSGGSAPKIETSISQLRIERTPRAKQKLRVPMYSTSTMSPTDATYCREQGTESWSATGSSTSGQSVSSTGSKSQTRRSRSSRDLAWARRVISQHSSARDQRSTTATELDVNSFTTPPSER